MAVESPMSATLTEIEITAWRGFLRVHAMMTKELDAELDATHGVPLTHFEVLTALHRSEHGKLRMADLADVVLLSRSGMTRLVDRLEKQGLLERCSCSDDARGCYAVITPAGRGLVERALPTHLDGVRERFLAHLDGDDLRRLSEVWERMLV
jgi:DNA-binding MarR family transcriptional regulator